MNKISVIIDNSGSMSCLSKIDIIKTVCRNLLLQENFDFDFYEWSDFVEKISFENNGVINISDKKTNLYSLVDFIKSNSDANLLILTDGFIEGDTAELTSLIKQSELLKVRLVGIGADCSFTSCKKMFPASYLVTAATKPIFTTLEIDAALDSFLE